MTAVLFDDVLQLSAYVSNVIRKKNTEIDVLWELCHGFADVLMVNNETFEWVKWCAPHINVSKSKVFAAHV